MQKFIITLILITAITAIRAEDIKTSDGTVYHNARIVGSNPTGIDISYQKDGRTVLKGLRFETLPESIQKRYGYDPNASKSFDREVTRYQGTDMNKDIASRRIPQQVNSSTYYMMAERTDLKALVYAYRRSVKVSPVSGDSKGSVVMVNELLSGKPIKADLIYVEGLKVQSGTWTGMIYPAAVKIRVDGFNFGLRVFTTTLDRSTQILAENMQPSSSTDSESESQPALVGSNEPDDTTSVEIELTPYDDEPMSVIVNSSGTYIGGVYYPNWRRPHKPHRPQKPQKPQRPQRPQQLPQRSQQLPTTRQLNRPQIQQLPQQRIVR